MLEKNHYMSGSRVIALLIAAGVLAACSVPQITIKSPLDKAPDSAYRTIDAKLEQERAERRAREAEANAIPPEDRTLKESSSQELTQSQPRLYSFRARQLNIRDALAVFARANGLNLITDPDLSGQVTVDFTDVPLNRAFEVLLSSLGYSWEQTGGVIWVRSTVTRIFEIDYIRSTQSSSTGGVAAAPGSGGAAVWGEIEAQVKGLLSPKGKLIINRSTGMVMVTDSQPRVDVVEKFINMLKDGLNRQVDIEVRIVEVALSDDFALGLDWSRLNLAGGGTALALSTLTGAGAISTKPATFALTYSGDKYGAVLQALKQQGDVRMVSQPRVRILNNQTASVKVGTTETFYNRTNFRTTQQGVGVIDTINEQANAVTVGMTMTVTPQISSDGWTMLNIAPTMTRLIGTSVSPSGQSTAPILDIKEASTMVRARSGELVVLGGLIEETNSATSRAIPGVGELPMPFNPFRGDYKASKRKELVIFLMPNIISAK
jgi:MSHA biogenesis protein MshL